MSCSTGKDDAPILVDLTLVAMVGRCVRLVVRIVCAVPALLSWLVVYECHICMLCDGRVVMDVSYKGGLDGMFVLQAWMVDGGNATDGTVIDDTTR